MLILLVRGSLAARKMSTSGRERPQPAEVAPARESGAVAALPALVFPLDPLSEATPPAKWNPQGENPSATKEVDWGGCRNPRAPGCRDNVTGAGTYAPVYFATTAPRTPDSGPAARPCSRTRTAWRAAGKAGRAKPR